jgi:transposase
MAKVQKTYTREFKEEAVRLVQTSGKPIAQIARELGISDSAIHGWRKELSLSRFFGVREQKEAFIA